MAPPWGEDRPGFVAMPRAWREAARAHLEPAQRALLDDLAEGACWEPREAQVAGVGAVRLDVGELLVSTRGLSESSGLSRDQVRRALARFEALGFIEARPAAPPPTSPPAPQAAPWAAPPPTVVRVLKYRETFWPAGEAAPPPPPPPAPQAAPPPAPIQQGNQEPEHGEASSPTPAALRLELEQAPPEASPHQRAVQAWFAAWEASGRGKHPTLSGAEALAIKRMVGEFGAEDLVERFGRAFADPWFVQHGDLLTFQRQRGKFAPPGRVGRPPAQRDVPRRPRVGPPAWLAMLDHADAHVTSAPFLRDLASVTVEEAAGELLVTPTDVYQAARLSDPFAAHLARLAREAAPGVLVRLLPPLRGPTERLHTGGDDQSDRHLPREEDRHAV